MSTPRLRPPSMSHSSRFLADPEFQFGTRFKESELDQPSKRTIVDLYQRATGKKLLLDAAD